MKPYLPPYLLTVIPDTTFLDVTEIFGIDFDVYERLAAVPAVTVAADPVEKEPFVIVSTPLETEADAPEAEVTTVAGVTAVGVLVVHAVMSSAGIAVPAEAEPTDTVDAVTLVT